VTSVTNRYAEEMIRGILLDIDGTLVLSNDAHAHSWVDAFAEFGYTVSYDEVRWLIGMGGDKLISTVQPDLNDSEGVGKQIKEARSKIFLEKYAPDLIPAPGSRELLQTLLARDLKLIAASSSKQDELDVLLKAAEVDDLLTEATTSDDAENSKPDPDIVEVALDQIGFSADEVLMLGDTPYDINAAKKAGVRCVVVRSGGWPDSKLHGALAIYDDPADVLAHFNF
jgi:HAD superfamily hydrolase (TIGR01509 family)